MAMKTFYEMMEIMEADQEDIQASRQQDQPEPQNQEKGLGDEAGAVPQQGGGNGMQQKHYMFFSNLKAIKKMVEEMLSMDPSEVDQMLDDGHDWASDHISTSRDDVEEVHNWLSGSVGGQDAGGPSAANQS